MQCHLLVFEASEGDDKSHTIIIDAFANSLKFKGVRPFSLLVVFNDFISFLNVLNSPHLP